MININFRKIKNLLAKLIVASQGYKKILCILETKLSTIILNLLKNKGFIYGYVKSKYNKTYTIFLKYSVDSSLLTNFKIINKHLSFKALNSFEKNIIYLLWTGTHYFLTTIDKKQRGYIIAKL